MLIFARPPNNISFPKPWWLRGGGRKSLSCERASCLEGLREMFQNSSHLIIPEGISQGYTFQVYTNICVVAYSSTYARGCITLAQVYSLAQIAMFCSHGQLTCSYFKPFSLERKDLSHLLYSAPSFFLFSPFLPLDEF